MSTPQGIFELGNRLPPWLRPTYRGALFILGMSFGTGGRIFVATLLGTFMVMGGAVAGALLFLRLLGVAVIAGAVAGSIQGALYGLDNWGGLGTWIRWTLTMFGYVVVFGFLTPNWPFSLRDPALYVLAAGLATLGAALLMVVDDRRPSRLTPRRLFQLQQRELMWVSADRVRDFRPGQPAGAGPPFEEDAVERATARDKVKEAWIGTLRRSRSTLGWWTRS